MVLDRLCLDRCFSLWPRRVRIGWRAWIRSKVLTRSIELAETSFWWQKARVSLPDLLNEWAFVTWHISAHRVYGHRENLLGSIHSFSIFSLPANQWLNYICNYLETKDYIRLFSAFLSLWLPYFMKTLFLFIPFTVYIAFWVPLVLITLAAADWRLIDWLIDNCNCNSFFVNYSWSIKVTTKQSKTQ